MKGAALMRMGAVRQGYRFCPGNWPGLALAGGPLARRQTTLKALGKARQRQPEGAAKGAQFHNVEPPLAAFALADKGLALAETGSQRFLRQPARFAGRPELPKKYGVLGRCNALVQDSPGSIEGEKGIGQKGLFAGAAARRLGPRYQPARRARPIGQCLA